ncbi:hypothetical protein [Ottowia oryzae]
MSSHRWTPVDGSLGQAGQRLVGDGDLICPGVLTGPEMWLAGGLLLPRSAGAGQRRRVLHFVFASPELLAGLRWHWSA